MKSAKRTKAEDLRRLAEEILAAGTKKASAAPQRDALALIHELQVHQIELEMQNEELCQAQAEADKLRHKFEHLYDFAPVGYLTLDGKGTVKESNLAAAACLGITRDRLRNAPFISFLAVSSVLDFREFMSRALAGGAKQRCEVKLSVNRGDASKDTLVEGIAEPADDGTEQVVRIALVDVSERRRAEEALRQSARDITRYEQLEQELIAKNEHLQELNVALKVILDQRDKEKKGLEEDFSENVNRLILPYLGKMRKIGLNSVLEEYVQIVESNLKEIVRPFGHKISEQLMQLSPAETRIMNFIKQGHSSKKIASLLNLSQKTVEFHRDNVRKKLGIKRRKINLKTYLSSL